MNSTPAKNVSFIGLVFASQRKNMVADNYPVFNALYPQFHKKPKLPNPKWIWAVLVMLAIVLLFFSKVKAETLTASYYTIASCLREGTSGIMANGRRLNDNKLTCASWDYSFGTILIVTNLANGKKCQVVVTDRGPAKRLYRMGRKLDLSQRAFSEIANLKQGVIPIRLEVLNG